VTATREPRSEPLEAPAVDADGTDRLTIEAARLRSRRSVPIDRGFQLVGAVLLGVGVLAIVAGWYGVSHTARQWRQTPYVVSGGLLGLALVVIGAVAYLAFWLTKLVEQNHRQTAVLERLEQLLGGARADDAELVVVPPATLHRASCPLVLGRDDARPPTAKDAKDKALTACPVCEPPPL